jgi:DNA mismatch repair protein PMS2
MLHIRELDKSLSHQICAEQVATDLKSIIKELLDNSLDAQAKSINIRVRNFGLESIEVWDNGTGILPEDFELLARKGATSKISSIEDIYTTLSYGYRV